MRRFLHLTAGCARRLSMIAVSLLILGASAGRSPAANGTWTGFVNGTWGFSSNWFSGVIPGTIGTTTNPDTALFNGSSLSTSIVPDLNRNLEFITFDSSPAAYTIGSTGGNPLVLTSGGTIQIASTFSGSNIAETINAPLTLEGNYTFANNTPNAGVSLNFGGPIINATASQTLTIAGAGNTTIGGAIGGGTGTIALIKNGAGILTLNGNNTYSGTTINSGTVLLGNATALGSSAFGTTIASGATLDLGGQTIGGNLVISGSGVGGKGALINSSGAASVISGITADTPFTVGGSGNITVSYLLDGGVGSLSLTKIGAGTLFLYGNNTYTGTTTVNAGTLALLFGGALGSTAGGTTIGSGGVLDLNGQAVGTEPLSILAGGTLTNSSLAASFAGRIDMALHAPGNVNGDTYPINLSGSVNRGMLTKAGTNTLTLSGTSDNVDLGVVVNSGTLVLAKTSSVSPPVHAIGFNGLTVGGGAAQLSGTGNAQIWEGASVTVTSGAFDTNGQSNTVLTLSLQGTGIGGSGALVNGATAASTITPTNGTTLTGDTTIGVSQAGGSLTLNNGISGNFALTEVGAGTLILNGNSSFTGGLTIAGGTFAMTGAPLASNVLNQSTFAYSGGTFNGRLTNAGTVTFNAPFIAGNGLENDASLAIGLGQSVTLNGQGLDNEGTLSVMTGGTLNLGATGANLNRGNVNLAGTLGMAGALLANQGSLTLNGALINGAGGLLTNGPGGTITGTGTISTGFINSAGAIVVGPGAINITQPFTNSGGIQLAAINANLTGGTISNAGSVQGFGNLGSAVTNNGIVEAMGGTLFVTGALANPSAGTLVADSGAKLLVTQGLAANAGIINLTGGTFDNNNHPLTNAASGHISGWGVFRTGGAGLDNNGSITFTGGLTTINGPVTNENGRTITVAQNPAIFTGLLINNMGGTFRTTNTTATFAGGFTNNGNSNFASAGNGTIDVPVAPSLGSASSLAVNDTSTLRFVVDSGASTIGTGVSATVNNGATLELAGSVSALSSVVNRARIINNSTAAAGLLVSGTRQQVGNIDGAGTTKVNAGSDLTADHIIQSALAIGGTSGSHGLVTIAASDSSGNSLDVGVAALAGGEGTEGGTPILAPGNRATAGLDLPLFAEGFDGDPIPVGPFVDGGAADGNPQSVPEPSTLALLLLAFGGSVCFGSTGRRRRKARD